MTASAINDKSAEPEHAWRNADLPGSGRGIVICAGGVQMFTNAWVLVRHLRDVLQCPLPVEVWHLGREEMSGGMRGMLEDLNVKVVDAFSVLARFPARIEDGWQLKPYALMMSGFREVLVLDADNVPAVDPAFLFDSQEFADTGAVFWPDAIDISETNPIWLELGLPPARQASFETGQILVDKSRHHEALRTVLHLNEEAERYYKLIYGDKDTFLMAWLLAGARYSLVPHRPIMDRYVAFQRDFDGEVLFQHRTNAKWKYRGEQARPQGFIHADDCDEALTELRRIWNGLIYEPPPRSPGAIRMEQSIAGQSFLAISPGEMERVIELLPYWQIGAGRDHNNENWHVIEQEPGAFVLRILDRHGVRLELHRQDDGVWLEAGEPSSAMSLKATGPEIDAANRQRRNPAFVRDLADAVLGGNGWTPEAEQELRAAFATLCRLDPLFASDVEAYADRVGQEDETISEGLRGLAAELKRLVDARPKGQPLRRHDEIIFDPLYYVRP